MPDLTAKLIIDLSAARGAFAEVRKLQESAQTGKGFASGGAAAAAKTGAAFRVAGEQARNAAGQFAAAGGGANRFFRAVQTAGKVGETLAGLTNGASALVKWYRALRGSGPPALNQTAAATRAVAVASRQAQTSTASLFGRLAKGVAVAGAAAAAVWGVTRAWRALGAVRQPNLKPPPLPGAGGGLAGMLGKSFAPLAIGGALAVGAGSLFGAIKDQVAGALKGAADLEQLEISFEVLTGGLEPAKKALADIRNLSENTPLRFADVAGAGRMLLAFGESTGGLEDTLRRVGDISTAIQAPIGEIAEIYGKARVQGTLFAEDINQLTGRGIPILTEFAAILGRSPAEIKKLASEGKVTFPMLEKAFQNMTDKGGQFFGMMARQSVTVAGLWSTFQDRLTGAMTALGKPINDALRPMLKQAVDLAGALKARAAAFGESIAKGIDFLRAAFATLGTGDWLQLLGKGIAWAFQMGLDTLIRGVSAVVKAFQDAEFLDGLEVRLKSVFLLLKDTLLAAVEAAMAALSDLPGIGKKMAKAAEIIGYTRQIDTLNAAAEARKRAREGRPEVDLSGIVARYFAESKGIFGKSLPKLEAELAKILEPVLAKAAENTAERRRERAAEDAGKKPDRDGLIPAAAGANVPSVVGAFQRAVNLIGGGTVNELIANEAKKTNSLLDAIKKDGSDTKRATEKIARETGKAPAVTVEVVPTFS